MHPQLSSASFEHAYRLHKSLWGLHPSSVIRKSIRFAPKVASRRLRALDAGVGEGKDALFLARKGFNVLGVDSSKSAVKRFLENTRRFGLRTRIKGLARDLSATDIGRLSRGQKFDIVVSNSVLNFMPEKAARLVLANLQKNTARGGLAVISIYKEGDEQKGIWLVKPEELKNTFASSEWNVIHYREYVTEPHTHPHAGRPMRHAVAEIIARKKR
ncbi:methyltransferase domain-containing protein [archaeon]|nr:methyltransferase domain-containing protein [archaeon]